MRARRAISRRFAASGRQPKISHSQISFGSRVGPVGDHDRLHVRAPNFAKRFVRETGCEYYVAPRKSPTYATAIYFAHVLYHKYFRSADRYGREIRKIVADFNERHKNVADFWVAARRRRGWRIKTGRVKYPGIQRSGRGLKGSSAGGDASV